MRYLHTMVRVKDLDASLDFYCAKLGLKEVRRIENQGGRFTLVFLCAPDDFERAQKDQAPMVELTYNWDAEDYKGGRNFGHLAYRVDNIYDTCKRLMEGGVTINRPRATATWRSSARRMESRLSCCRKAGRCRPPSLGRPCRTSETGSLTQ